MRSGINRNILLHMNSVLAKKILPYLIIFLGIAYGVWPVDVMPDIPIVGWIDDLGIIGLAILLAVKLFSDERNRNNTI